jgi:chromosome segregation ATPase
LQTLTRQHPADKSRAEVRDKIRELSRETETIEAAIKDVEIKAARETDEQQVLQLLAERKRLVERREALPFLLRGAKAQALRAQAEALGDEASAVKADLDAAEQEVASVTERVTELQRLSVEAAAALEGAKRRRDDLAEQYTDLSRGASSARTDAYRVEQDMPLLEPDRFDV